MSTELEQAHLALLGLLLTMLGQRVRLKFLKGVSLSGQLEHEDSWRRLLLRLQQRHTLSAARVRTGADGRFIVPHLLPVLHRLTFSKPGYVLAGPLDGKQGLERLRWLAVPPGHQEHRVLMIDNGRVSGRVVRAVDGEPVLDFMIDRIPITSTDGRFTMSAGAPGPHWLELVAPGVGGLRREYTAREGEDPEPSPVFTVKTVEVPGPQSTLQVDLQPPSP